MDSQNLLPSQVWSGSRHICEKYPDTWILGWRSSDEKNAVAELRDARAIIGLSDDEFAAAQRDFNDLHDRGDFGFPNVFMKADLALEKYGQYFYNVTDIKVLGLGLPALYLQNFLNHYKSEWRAVIRENGVYQKLEQAEVCAEGSIIGYDLLGFDGADYCSFLCGSMEAEIHEKYGVQYNQYGLIAEFEQAERVSRAIAAGEETAEDGFWAP